MHAVLSVRVPWSQQVLLTSGVLEELEFWLKHIGNLNEEVNASSLTSAEVQNVHDLKKDLVIMGEIFGQIHWWCE